MSTNNNMTRINFLILFFIICSVYYSQAGELSAKVAVSPIGDFTAEIKDFEGKAIKKVDGTFVATKINIPWSGIKTGMSLRDKHALKYVNADKYPNIEIISALGKAGKGVSKIRFNNVEKLIKGTYEINEGNLIASFVIKLSEFNIKDVSFKGAGVQDDINVTMSVPIEELKQ